MKKRIAFLIILISTAAIACGLLVACGQHVHNFQLVSVETEPTCTENGVGLYRCNCGEENERELAALGHEYGEWRTYIPATCEAEGARWRVCNRNAKHFKVQNIPAFGHDWKPSTTVKPTCTEDGIQYLVCNNDHNHIDSYIISATGHKFVEWQTVREAGCVSPGLKGSSCEHCDYWETVPYPAIAHNFVGGVCHDCGRNDWSVAGLYDVDLYNSEYGFRALATEESGACMQALYALIDIDARDFHNAQGRYNHLTSSLGEYDYAALNLTFDQAVDVWKTYMDDHPLYYWLGRTLQYAEKLNVPVNDNYSSPLKRKQTNEEIYKIANEWREAADDNAYLATLSFHDRIIYTVDYAYLEDGRTPQTAIWAHNIIGVFTGQGAVCEGYARTFQLLLNMKGIDNVFVTGTSNGKAHAWNLVKLDDDQWYWFDLTYDDVPGWMWGVKYNYFAVTDNQDVNWSDGGWTTTEVPFTDNHTPDSGMADKYLYPLPERSQTPYNGVGEMLLRQTFTIGKFTYALVGYDAVQLIRCSAEGEIFVPEYVEYGGVTYEVISIGSMEEDGRLSSSLDDNPVFTATKLTTLHIPSTVRFLWENARPNGDDERSGASVEAYDVAEDNRHFTSVDGVLFTKSMFTLIAYPGASPRTEYYIPDIVTNIAEMAFCKAENLRSLTFGSGVWAHGNLNWGRGWLKDKTTGSLAFTNGLRGIFNSSYRSPAPYALEEIYVNENNPYFSAANGILFNKDKTRIECVISTLTEITIPATVKSFAHVAFFNSHKLQNIFFEGTREQWYEIQKETGWDISIGKYYLTCLGDL